MSCWTSPLSPVPTNTTEHFFMSRDYCQEVTDVTISGEYYMSDLDGNMVLFNLKVLDIGGANTVTVTVLLGSDVILTPK